MNALNFRTDMQALEYRPVQIADLEGAVTDYVKETDDSPEAARLFIYRSARTHFIQTGRPRGVGDLRTALVLRAQLIRAKHRRMKGHE